MKVIVLPMTRGLYKFLDELAQGNFGRQLTTMVLTGFIRLMTVRNFDLKKHLSEIDDLDDIFGFEARDFKLDLSVSITRMSLSYRNYFSTSKYKSITVRRCSYNKHTLRFSFEVLDERE